MIHPKTPPPPYSRQRKRKSANSGRKLLEPIRAIQLDEQTTPKVSNDIQESSPLGFFEAIEHEKAQAEMAKMLQKKKNYPIAPDALIPNSTIRSMFKRKEIEPVQMKLFQLRLIPMAIPNPIQIDLNEQLKRYSVLTNFDDIHSTIFQSLNRIDILENLQNKTNKNLNWQNDDDEWVELGDPDAALDEPTSKPSSGKTKKNQRPITGTLIARQKFGNIESIDYDILYDEDNLPEIFKRMKNERWWPQGDDEGNNNLRLMLLTLIDTLRDKQNDSYESACNYVIEIFRTYGIEPTLVDQILGIFLDHLVLNDNDPLDVHTVRAIAQFMMEKKTIIIQLLNYASKHQPDDILRQETINAIKFITDVNNSDDIDLVLNNMSLVRDAAEDTFSLKTIIDRIKAKLPKDPSNLSKEGEESEENILHPLLKKISEERWYPRDNNPITLDTIINAILMKLPNASKTMLKTLTTHLVQLNRAFNYSNEQYERISQSLITLLSHNDADYRLIAATVLADLGKETKVVDLALLNSFLNDPRILVRTECCDTLKKLTGIMSDTVLKDCADDIPYLQTLPEEDFTLQNYLKQKNRVPTPPPTNIEEQMMDEQPPGSGEENQEEETIQPTDVNQQEEPDTYIEDSTHLHPADNQVDDTTTPIIHSRSTTPHYEEEEQEAQQQPFIQINQRHIIPPPSHPFSITPSVNSSTAPITPVEPPIRVEISEKTKPFIPLPQQVPQTRKDITPALPPPPPPSSQPARTRRQPTEMFNRTPIKITVSDQTTGRRHLLLPNSSNMWDSYSKQNEFNEDTSSQILATSEIIQEPLSDPVQTILDDHKRHIGYYRMRPNRPVLIPHKISFDDVFGDQSHITVDRKTPFRSPSSFTNTMHLSDLNRNKHHLHEVEFVQLVSSLLIRSIQIHRKHESFIPGVFSSNSESSMTFTDALTISQMQLHSPTSLDQANFYIPHKLPPIVKERPSSAELARMKSDAQARAKRTGVNLRKAKDMEDVLSHVLKTDREQSRSTFAPANTPHPTTLVSSTDQSEITHAWLLEQLLKAQGATDSQSYIQQICRTYPKFTPLLHSRIPQNLIPIIWNDPVMKQLASIVSNKPDDSSEEDSFIKRAFTKPSIPPFDDEHSSNFFDYSASNHLLTMQQQQREENKKRHLPPVRGVKMRLPRHVIKFGFRELETDSPEASLDSLRDENISKSRRRRIYMHLMMSVNENMLLRHELVKSQLRHMLKTDYRSTSFLPIIAKPPVCN